MIPMIPSPRAVLACLALAVSSVVTASEQHQIVRIHAADAGLRHQLGDLFGHIGYDETTGIAMVETDVLGRDRLRRLGIGWQVDADATAAYQAFIEHGVDGLRAIPGYACYRTVEETFASIDTMVAHYPVLASSIDIGDSWRRVQDPGQGYPLRVLRLGNREATGKKPAMFAMSSVHAREYTPAELMTRFAERMLAGYGSDANATWLLDNFEFHLLLHSNPDGRKRAEQAVLWRKNENINHCPQMNGNPDGNSHPGVDLNRNFPFNWQPGGTGPQQCSAVYPGVGAASEPETQAIRDYVLDIFPDTRPGTDLTAAADPDTSGLFLDMHSYTGLVLWPWGVSVQSGNEMAFRHLGRRLAWFNNYTPQQSVALYPTYGTTVDFAYGERGVPALTFELGTAFFENCNTFQSTILPDNLAALDYAARSLHAPYRLPWGPDSYNVAASNDKAVQGETVRISATVNDGRYRNEGGSGSALAIQNVAAAHLYVDRLPWQPGATGMPMLATDGNFDASMESVHLDLDTAALPVGRHLLYVQGTDADGHAGAPSAVFLEIKADPDRLFADGFEPPPGSP